jgi:hypothetical protein
MAASYLVMLLIILLYGKTIWKDPFFLASLMFFFLFLVFPKIVGGATATDIRWLVPAYILPFCCAGSREAIWCTVHSCSYLPSVCVSSTPP